ncbi:Hypothetical protein Tpal_2131 [Trichococcus palustris]|uniref:Glycosyl hydrolase family 13 catalytic domain-containing protein n=1 Tax=Trichococcus palustris TaxID=140314 RepID=A0A143YUB8_9LACT|nr:alpha-glucosidase [Trichococcus palustris]CZQ97311.1 Hypothetical protein Tpal_2131 [Trichococcus palustris]SFK76084.1 alpha-glucosidase [Trichococcus palustris]
MGNVRKWWHDLIVYQVYPMSFQDSNGDGVGDVRGVIKRLDYIQLLGVNMIWLNPIFTSPKIDNGYDISDFMAIDPLFGTMEEVEELIQEAHKRGIKVIFDFVMNHTSNQHPWFKEALKGKDNPYRDYYLWADGKNGGKDLPNNWESFFTGTVWEKEPIGDQYYFHLFAKEMPDLNWENPEVRKAMIEIAFFWLDKGIDGFRLDAFIHLQKEAGFPDLPGLKEGEIALAENYYANLPKINEYMKFFTTTLRERYPDTFIVGEAASATVDLAHAYTDPILGGCDTVITFRYFTMDESAKDPRLSSNMQKTSLLFGEFKKNMHEWQRAMADVGGPTLYWNNHDMARVVSRIGDDVHYRDDSAKMLAVLMYLQKGIPFILNGEELGMKNLYIDDIRDFNSPEAQTFYEEALALGYTEESILHNLRESSKDASRGAMQWDDSAYAGFSEVKPWSGVNIEPAYNVEAEEDNPESVLHFYRRMLQLKKTDLFVDGSYFPWDTDDDFYVYERVLNKKGGLVICNVTDQPQEFVLPPLEQQGYRHILLQNSGVWMEGDNVHLGPYGAVVFQTDYTQ